MKNCLMSAQKYRAKYAIISGSTLLLKYLQTFLDQYVINSKDEADQPFLHTDNPNINLISELLETSLKWNNMEAVKILMQHARKLELLDTIITNETDFGQRVKLLIAAVRTNNIEAVNKLLQSAQDANCIKEVLTARGLHTTLLKITFEEIIFLPILPSELSPLHWAVLENNNEIVDAILKAAKDSDCLATILDTQDIDGYTPLVSYTHLTLPTILLV